MSRLIEAGGGLFNLATRIVYVPAAIVSWFFAIAQQWRIILSLFVVGIIGFSISTYGGTIASAVLTTMQTDISPIWVNQIRPIFVGIIQTFFNPLTCWYNGFVIFPYSVGRNVLFPILREGGLLTTAQRFAMFLSRFAKDFFLEYFASGLWLSQEFDYSGVFASWQNFMIAWQGLWCFGCNDLCPYYTKTPNPIVSNQLRDTNWGDFLGKSFNGWMIVIQQTIYLVRQVVYPNTPTLPYLNFNRAFELWCQASTNLRISFENILQEFWDAFIEYNFVWDKFLCFFDATTCVLLRLMNFTLNLIIHADSTLSHFRNTDSSYWNNVIKKEAMVIMNSIGPTDYFDTIVLDITNINTYQLLTITPAFTDGTPNPLFNTSTVGECFCIALNRIICDPQANGTTCKEQYNGTLLADIDPCCITNTAASLMSNMMAFTFEFTLHFISVPDFLQFIDKQPFTNDIAYGISNTVNCLWQIFRIVQTFGFCIERILAELTNFVVLTGELIFRIFIALLVTPYYNENLPGQCNFITCPSGPNSPINMATQYLNRISNASLPDGLINCLCFTLNTGFNVPFAGCGNFSCTPVGFIQPTGQSRRFSKSTSYHGIDYRQYVKKSIYEHISVTGEHAHLIKHYGDTRVQFTLDSERYKTAFSGSFDRLNGKLDEFGKKMGKCGNPSSHTSQCPLSRKRTLIPLNITEEEVNCTAATNTTFIPCFGLCCLPVKIIDLLSHTILFSARAINGAFQTRFGNGSTYWDGQACMDNEPCFQSDLTMEVVKLIAPVECLCQFIKLVLPPQGFGDPCCAFYYIAELISCFLQIIINIGNSVAGDGPNFTYIKGNATLMEEPQMIKDFDVVLDIALKTFDCVCNFVRTIFALSLIHI